MYITLLSMSQYRKETLKCKTVTIYKEAYVYRRKSLRLATAFIYNILTMNSCSENCAFVMTNALSRWGEGRGSLLRRDNLLKLSLKYRRKDVRNKRRNRTGMIGDIMSNQSYV